MEWGKDFSTSVPDNGLFPTRSSMFCASWVGFGLILAATRNPGFVLKPMLQLYHSGEYSHIAKMGDFWVMETTVVVGTHENNCLEEQEQNNATIPSKAAGCARD